MKLSKSLVFKIILAIYLGLAVFRLTDPSLKWFLPKSTPMPAPVLYAPSEIKISKINLDLQVSASVVKDNDWQLFDDRVAWLSTSAKPGNGNTILYAHDRKGLFGDLYKLKVGDEIGLRVNDKWVYYKVTDSHKVLPTDVASILSDQNRLTLFTCNGSFDQKRLVVYAESE